MLKVVSGGKTFGLVMHLQYICSYLESLAVFSQYSCKLFSSMGDYKKLITIEIAYIKKEFFRNTFGADSLEHESGLDDIIGVFICFNLCISLHSSAVLTGSLGRRVVH